LTGARDSLISPLAADEKTLHRPFGSVSVWGLAGSGELSGELVARRTAKVRRFPVPRCSLKIASDGRDTWAALALWCVLRCEP
jgi:hypothetical protein